MKKNELILSVRDLNIKFNLRGKILHASGASTSMSTTAKSSHRGRVRLGQERVHQVLHGSAGLQRLHHFRHHRLLRCRRPPAIRLSELKKEKDWLKVRGHEIAMIMQDPMTSLNPLKTIGDQIMEPWSSIRPQGRCRQGEDPRVPAGCRIADRKCASSSIPTSSRAVCASVSSSPSLWPATRRS